MVRGVVAITRVRVLMPLRGREGRAGGRRVGRCGGRVGTADVAIVVRVDILQQVCLAIFEAHLGACRQLTPGG